MKYDEGLEEIWRIKREIASEYASLADYFKGMSSYQEELKRQGVKFVHLPPKRVSKHDGVTPLFASEDGVEYDAQPPVTDPAP